MNYLALAGGILAVLIALYCLSRLLVVAIGKQRFESPVSAFIVQSLFVAGTGTLAAWLFGMVAS